MYKYVQNNDWPSYFTVERTLAVARQCLDALAFIHASCLVHCDLKPENILIQSQSRCVVKVRAARARCGSGSGARRAALRANARFHERHVRSRARRDMPTRLTNPTLSRFLPFLPPLFLSIFPLFFPTPF